MKLTYNADDSITDETGRAYTDAELAAIGAQPIRPEVQQFLELREERDCTADESARIMHLLDDGNDNEREQLASVWPLEFDQWVGELEDGTR